MENFDFTEAVRNLVYRRTWLLYKALETAPLHRAIDLAREADGFVTAALPAPSPEDSAETAAQCSADDDHPIAMTTGSSIETIASPLEVPTIRLQLSAEQRGQLLQRLADGATNADVAAEFKLSPRQVQGFRMGSARSIAKTQHVPEKKLQAEAMCVASPEEIVRYLRQRDDVVVPQQEGQYLVNGRFNLSLAALVDRANRMRSRQGKAQFELAGHLSPGQHAPANGHSTLSA